MPKTKTIEEMMSEMTNPVSVELQTRYQNARDAVSWAYKMAQERIVGLPTPEGYSKAVSFIARELTPLIEADLNATLSRLNEVKST